MCAEHTHNFMVFKKDVTKSQTSNKTRWSSLDNNKQSNRNSSLNA